MYDSKAKRETRANAKQTAVGVPLRELDSKSYEKLCKRLFIRWKSVKNKERSSGLGDIVHFRSLYAVRYRNSLVIRAIRLPPASLFA
jgi:hypothetical protein